MAKNYDDAYRFEDRIEADASFMEQLVKTEPEKAFRFFHLFKYKPLGVLLVETYKDSSDYNHSAFFVSVAISAPITRMESKFPKAFTPRGWGQDEILRHAERDWSRNYCGNPHPDSEWRQQAGADNNAGLYEQD
ncbi:MAG: hypothetical protein AABX66_04370 [Nanoarchaeota archaeon]